MDENRYEKYGNNLKYWRCKVCRKPANAIKMSCSHSGKCKIKNSKLYLKKQNSLLKGTDDNSNGSEEQYEHWDKVLEERNKNLAENLKGLCFQFQNGHNLDEKLRKLGFSFFNLNYTEIFIKK